MKKRQYICSAISGLVLLSLILNSCKETGHDPKLIPDFPKVSLYVSSVTASSAVFQGSIYNPAKYGIFDRGFYWSATSHDPTKNDCVIISAQSGTFTETLTGITPNTNYWVKAYTKYSSQGEACSEVIKFVTLSKTP